MEKAVDDLSLSTDVPWENNACTKGRLGRPKRTSTAAQQTSNVQSSLDRSNRYTFETVDGMSLDQILPPPSKQRELLNQMVLNLTEEEYRSRTLSDTNSNSAQVHGSNDNDARDLNNDRIKPNESEGVFRF